MSLYFKQAGEGPPLVLLHGLFGSLENLGMIARLLASTYTVYSVDLPNHGRSGHTDHTSLGLMAQSVAEWLEQQSLSQVRLFGHSLGGKVAMELALSQPQIVSHLAVADIAPVQYESHHTDVFAGLNALNIDALSNRGEADKVLTQYVSEAPVRSFLLKNLVKEGASYRWRMNLSVLQECYPAMLVANREGLYQGPTLFLKGANSDYIQPAAKTPILSRFPGAQVRIIANTGHWLHADKPELVVRTLEKFYA